MAFQVDPVFDQFFWSLKYLYWYLPIHPYRRFVAPVTQRTLILGLIFYRFVLASQVLLLVLYTLFVINSIAEGGDFIATTATMVWLILDINAIHSAYFSWNSWRELVALFQLLHDAFPKTAEEKAAVCVEQWAKRWSFKMKALTVSFILAVLGMVTIPIVKSIIEFGIYGVWTNQLPISIWIPFDPYVMPRYPLVYLLETWMFFTNTWIIVAVSCLLGAVTMLICLEFQRVATRFRTIPYGDFEKDLQAVREAIDHHNLIQGISLKMREIFSMALFCVFVVSSMVICLFLFLILNERGYFARFQYTLNLVCYLIYCSVYAFYGNQVIENSISVATAVYDSDWVNADYKIQKLLVVVIRQANTPHILTGMDFFIASFPTLSKILTTSYSYFTLLRASYK